MALKIQNHGGKYSLSFEYEHYNDSPLQYVRDTVITGPSWEASRGHSPATEKTIRQTAGQNPGVSTEYI